MKERFVIVFISKIHRLYNLKGEVVFKVLFKLIENMKDNDCIIELSTFKRAIILDELKITQAQFSRALKSLKNSNILFSIKGLIIINPDMFWIGNMKKRNKCLELFKTNHELHEE